MVGTPRRGVPNFRRDRAVSWSVARLAHIDPTWWAGRPTLLEGQGRRGRRRSRGRLLFAFIRAIRGHLFGSEDHILAAGFGSHFQVGQFAVLHAAFDGGVFRGVEFEAGLPVLRSGRSQADRVAVALHEHDIHGDQ